MPHRMLLLTEYDFSSPWEKESTKPSVLWIKTAGSLGICTMSCALPIHLVNILLCISQKALVEFPKNKYEKGQYSGILHTIWWPVYWEEEGSQPLSKTLLGETQEQRARGVAQDLLPCCPLNPSRVSSLQVRNRRQTSNTVFFLLFQGNFSEINLYIYQRFK